MAARHESCLRDAWYYLYRGPHGSKHFHPFCHRIWLLAGSAIVLLFVLLTITFERRISPGARVHPLSSSTTTSTFRDLRSDLHPEEHSTRKPEFREFSWNITSGNRSPDGVWREVVLVNNKFPGPTVEARSGDTIQVQIHNFLNEGVSIHWHGLQMRGSNQMDGPVGITQCAIPPGGAFTYRFDIDDDESGTFWYHAHSETQRGDGLYGGFIVHEAGSKLNAQRVDMQEILLLVGDWYHQPSSQVLASFMNAANNGDEPCPDSLLINGMGYFDCSRALTAFPVNCTSISVPHMHLDKNMKYRIRLVNVGSMTGISLNIADAMVFVTHLDGDHEVVSYPANGLGVVYPGERVDFTLEWPETEREGESKMTLLLDKENFQKPNLALASSQTFVISPGALQNTANRDRNATIFKTQTAKGPTLAQSLPDPDKKFVIYSAIEILNHLNGIPTGFINRTHWAPQALLPLLATERIIWDDHQLVPWTGDKPVWVELVINNLDGTGHPFHLHGFNFYVISSYRGKGGWDYYNPFDVAKEPRGGPFNVLNPMQKDTVYVPSFGYVVVRFRADNEGIWALHCHILWHQASGMTMAFQVMGDEKTGFRETSMGTEARQSCMA